VASRRLAREIEVGSLRWDRLENEALEADYRRLVRLKERFRHVAHHAAAREEQAPTLTPEG